MISNNISSHKGIVIDNGQLNDNNATNTIKCAAHEKEEKMLITYR